MKTLNEIASVFASVARNTDADAYISALEAAGVTDEILLAYGLAICGDKLVIEAATREAVVAVAGAPVPNCYLCCSVDEQLKALVVLDGLTTEVGQPGSEEADQLIRAAREAVRAYIENRWK